MAKTEYLYFKGKCKWAKTNQLNKFGNWSIDLYLSPQELERFVALKTKNKVKTDPVDGPFISLSRPPSKVIKGKVVGFAPPMVVDAQGMPLAVYIGNGSDVTVKVDYYSYETPQKEKGYAARWSGVRVDNLVPYKPRSDMDQDQMEAVAGLQEQPEQLF